MKLFYGIPYYTMVLIHISKFSQHFEKCTFQHKDFFLSWNSQLSKFILVQQVNCNVIVFIVFILLYIFNYSIYACCITLLTYVSLFIIHFLWFDRWLYFLSCASYCGNVQSSCDVIPSQIARHYNSCHHQLKVLLFHVYKCVSVSFFVSWVHLYWINW